MKTSQNQTGSTLIEVLIAVLIFGLGMLGLLGLMTATAKYQTGNVARGQISSSIESLGERMRSNVAAVNGASTDNPNLAIKVKVIGAGYVYTADNYATQAARPLSDFWPPALDCMTTDCTSVQREAYDMLAWRAHLKQSLPGGAGLVTGNIRTGFNTTVMWFDKTAVKGDDAQFTDELQSNQVCNGTELSTSAAARFCCPVAAAAPEGVRCYNANINP
jgi:type IV pilus assembly protein PilV